MGWYVIKQREDCASPHVQRAHLGTEVLVAVNMNRNVLFGIAPCTQKDSDFWGSSFVSWDVVRQPTWYATCIGPGFWIWSCGWNEWEGKRKYVEKPCPSPSPILATTNLT
jgi:hypothetical protein